MEDIAWKKDETPYLVFACRKCRQYTYVKTTQKSKKCARCGRTHTVSDIMASGEVVYGISVAVETVKQKQDEFAKEELGFSPTFRTSGDFIIAQDINPVKKPRKKEDEENYEQKFEDMLMEITKMHEYFPYYVIEIMADNYCIPKSEVRILTRLFEKQGVLKKFKDYTYRVIKK
jgi:hypothetical protein